MHKRLSIVFNAAVFALATAAAVADTAPAGHAKKAEAALPKPLAVMQKRGALQVIRRFPADAGLTGFVIKERDGYTIVYGIGDYVMSGLLMAPDGHNLTAKYYAQYVPKPDYAKVVQQLEHDGKLITLGKNAAAPVLYAFEDPNCIFCYRFNKEAFPLVDKGNIQLKIVLVAFLKADSLTRATAILAAKDPAAALRENEDKYVASREEGGYPAPAKPVQKFVAAVQANGKVMRMAEFTGTPAILYRAKDGKWNGHRGMPNEGTLKKIIDGATAPTH